VSKFNPGILNLDIELHPRVISLLTEALLGCAETPIIIFDEPVSRLVPDDCPIKILVLPVELSPELLPREILLDPDTLSYKADDPKAML
jgi:hypothetical protein